eukprot:6194134-Pleurochrysis_carterae.AAC.1
MHVTLPGSNFNSGIRAELGLSVKERPHLIWAASARLQLSATHAIARQGSELCSRRRDSRPFYGQIEAQPSHLWISIHNAYMCRPTLANS